MSTEMQFEYGLKHICLKHTCQQMSTQSETSASLGMTRTQPKDYCLRRWKSVPMPKETKQSFSVYALSPTLVTAWENPIFGTLIANFAIAKKCMLQHLPPLTLI